MPRPSTYSTAKATEICRRLEEGETLRAICARPGMPDRSTVTRWIEQRPEFARQCARAHASQADLMDDRILEAIDKLERGALGAAEGRAIISTLQWRAARLAPKKYGDRLALEGDVKHTVTLAEIAAAVQRSPVLAALQARKTTAPSEKPGEPRA